MMLYQYVPLHIAQRIELEPTGTTHVFGRYFFSQYVFPLVNIADKGLVACWLAILL
jgi:hypothetical protein